ncbi:MAG: M42 family metallopeptidase [Chloroflexi bacterium]|nr:M42 family metallopeptidase [Chloroflexota bacterium]
MNLDLMKSLTQANGVPSIEDEVRKIVWNEMTAGTDDVRVDTMGNVIGHVAGNGGPKVAMAAHMDEIGFIVRYIEDTGYIRLQPVGGFDPRTLVAQRVAVHTRNDGQLVGTLMPGVKPIHLMTPGDKKDLELTDFFVDLGMQAELVKAKVQIGDMVTMRRDFEEIGDMVISKSLDDRIGVYVMLEAVKAAGKVDAELYPIATVQEEVGLRGATTAAFGVQPEICIALDTTIAGDIPGMPADSAVTKLGSGVAIKVFDSSQLPNRKLITHLREIAEQQEIPYQLEVLPRGGTDAGAFQRANDGVVTCTISIPSRYVHTVNEMCAKSDIQAAVDLLAQFLREAGTRDYSYDVE